jgi:peptidoglycan hydrolase-like protein with peptidoglycan-binding domain
MKKIISIVFISSFFLGVHSALASITSSLDIGSKGASVTELQTYLTNSTNFYPSGLITGYYGPLTEAAVEKFQTAQGIVSSGSAATTGYGRVGPTTMARLNSLMGSGSTVSMDTSPSLSATSVQYGSTNATLSWTTNEPTQGQVYYSNLPLVFNEASGPRQQPYVSGANSTDNGGLTNHSITIQNLQPNTTYYFLTRAVDSVGNMSMNWPSSFRTNQ